MAQQILINYQGELVDLQGDGTARLKPADIADKLLVSAVDPLTAWEQQIRGDDTKLSKHLKQIDFRQQGLQLTFCFEERSCGKGSELFLIFSAGPGLKIEYRLKGWSNRVSSDAKKWLEYTKHRLTKNLLFYVGSLFLDEPSEIVPLPMTLPIGKPRPHGGARGDKLQASQEQALCVARDYPQLLKFWKKQVPLLRSEFPECWRKMACDANPDVPEELFKDFETKKLKGEGLALVHACTRHQVKVRRSDGKRFSLTKLRELRRDGDVIIARNSAR